MALALSGATPTNTTFAAATRTAFVDGMKAALVTAGWSVSSGASGDWKLDSGTTPAGHQMRVRIYDAGSGNCARITPSNVAETKIASTDIFMLPGATDYRIICNAYQFFVLPDGRAPNTREFACGGVPYVPSHLSPSECAWAMGNMTSDTDTGVRPAFHTALYSYAAYNFAVYDANSWTAAGQLTHNGHIRAGSVQGADLNSLYFSRWQDNAAFICEPIIGWAASAVADEAKAVGLIWDAALVTESFLQGDIKSFPEESGGSNKSWFVLTNANAGTATASMKGSLLLKVP